MSAKTFQNSDGGACLKNNNLCLMSWLDRGILKKAQSTKQISLLCPTSMWQVSGFSAACVRSEEFPLWRDEFTVYCMWHNWTYFLSCWMWDNQPLLTKTTQQNRFPCNTDMAAIPHAQRCVLRGLYLKRGAYVPTIRPPPTPKKLLLSPHYDNMQQWWVPAYRTALKSLKRTSKISRRILTALQRT